MLALTVPVWGGRVQSENNAAQDAAKKKCATEQKIRRCRIKSDGKYDFTVDIPRSVCKKIANAKPKKKVHKKEAGECEICSGIRKDKDQNDDSNWMAVPKGTCATIKGNMGIK